MENNKASADEIFRFDKGVLSEDSDSDESENTSKDDYDEDCSANNKGQKNSYEEIWSPQSTSIDAPCSVYEDEDQILPSQVTDREYIFVPRTYEFIDENDEDVVKRGKWMIFTKGDINKLDEYWLALLPLYRRGILAGLKCSTVKSTGPGVINCYTADSENRLEVKIAADAIRDCIDNRKIIFYKTNQASLQGLYHHNENRNISKYMHTVHNDLLKR